VSRHAAGHSLIALHSRFFNKYPQYSLLPLFAKQTTLAIFISRNNNNNNTRLTTTRVSRYQKGKANLDFTEARDSEWQWHQLGRMHVCASLQTDNHTITPPVSFLQAGCRSCCPTNSVKAMKAKKHISYIMQPQHQLQSSDKQRWIFSNAGTKDNWKS